MMNIQAFCIIMPRWATIRVKCYEPVLKAPFLEIEVAIEVREFALQVQHAADVCVNVVNKWREALTTIVSPRFFFSRKFSI